MLCSRPLFRSSLALQQADALVVRLIQAVALFPGFELLDVAGPLEMINILNYQHPIELSLLSETLEPVSTKIASSTSRCYQSLVPTHTYAAPPEKINLLIVPGGPGTRVRTASSTVSAYLGLTTDQAHLRRRLHPRSSPSSPPSIPPSTTYLQFAPEPL